MTTINPAQVPVAQSATMFKGKCKDKIARNVLFSPQTKQYIKMVANNPAITAENKKVLLINQCNVPTIKEMLLNIVANIRAKFVK